MTFAEYECDRCGKPLVTEGYWSEIAESGACATEDGGVLCPQCFSDDPTVGMLMTDAGEDDAAFEMMTEGH